LESGDEERPTWTAKSQIDVFLESLLGYICKLFGSMNMDRHNIPKSLRTL